MGRNKCDTRPASGLTRQNRRDPATRDPSTWPILDTSPRAHNRSAGAELTVPAVLLGVLLSVVMGAANVYLGLRAGMTVSASIPAAVISMGILRGVLRRKSVLESNLVQTAASAGESLAAGIIFTMPALLLTGVWDHFDFWTTTLVALTGGLLGILLMIPMRQVFVVDNTELKFPEGVACAEVLRAGADELDDEGHAGTWWTRADPGWHHRRRRLQVPAIVPRSVSHDGRRGGVAIGRVHYLGADISPALLAVGYIVTLPIALQIFAGGALGWLIAIPWLSAAGVEASTPIDMAYEIWSTKVRYLGVGAMVVGGISSIWTVRSGLRAAIRHLAVLVGQSGDQMDEDVTSRNISSKLILGAGHRLRHHDRRHLLPPASRRRRPDRVDDGLDAGHVVLLRRRGQLHRRTGRQFEQPRLRDDDHRAAGRRWVDLAVRFQRHQWNRRHAGRRRGRLLRGLHVR